MNELNLELRIEDMMTRARELPQSDSRIELIYSEGNSAVIDLSGSKILALTLRGVRVIGEVTRANGKGAASHFCGPIAGRDRGTTYSFRQHGVERDIPWLDITSDEDRKNHKLVIAGKIIWDNYPDGVYVARTFEVGDDLFRCTSILLNTSDQDAPYNSRAHLYLLSPKGWEGVTMNGEAIQEVLKTNGTNMLQDENTLVIPGQYSFRLAQRGLPHGVGWVETNGTGGFTSDWFCIEPTEFAEEDFGRAQTIIAPHSFRTVEWTINNVTRHDV